MTDLADAITNESLSDQLASLINDLKTGAKTESQLADALLPLFNSWTSGGITMPQLAANLANVLGQWNGYTLEYRTWLSGTATGGYDSDGTPTTGVAPHGGYYPLRNGLGTTYYLACPAKLTGQTLKGDPAQTAVVLEIVGKAGASAIVGRYTAPGNQTFTNANSIGDAEVAATSTTTFTCYKNAVSVGTITFAASSSTAVFNFTGGTLTLARGDKYKVVAPAVPDATLTSPTFVHAGA